LNVFSPSSIDLSFVAAALAKLTEGRTVADWAAWGDEGVGGNELAAPDDGVLVCVGTFRSVAARELLLDIGWPIRSLFASRPFSMRSVISFSREETSTGLTVRKVKVI
jgi:hypothetical protein